jgi:hypothetical protein
MDFLIGLVGFIVVLGLMIVSAAATAATNSKQDEEVKAKLIKEGHTL